MPEKPTAWTVAEAKARLSEILRRAETEGPQRIGRRERYVLVPEALWEAKQVERPSLGQWLVNELSTGAPLELPDRRDPPRAIPFAEEM
ncbi:MAG: type II toxin-antitoxin system prevent-host-death family antitoxin [Pseudomonadota bacterium]